MKVEISCRAEPEAFGTSGLRSLINRMRAVEEDAMAESMMAFRAELSVSFMMSTTTESRSSLSTRSLATSTVDMRWPIDGHGTNTSSVLPAIVERRGLREVGEEYSWLCLLDRARELKGKIARTYCFMWVGFY